MNSLTILGYVIAMCLAPVAPFVVMQWARKVWIAAKALRVLSRERRTGESLYDTAEAIAGDAHNWRGMTSPRSDLKVGEISYRQSVGRTFRNGQTQKVVVLDVDGDGHVDLDHAREQLAKVVTLLESLPSSSVAERRNLESRRDALISEIAQGPGGGACIGDSNEHAFASDLIAPQPPPQNSDGPALWPMIISELGDSETERLVAIDMQERHEFGMAKYGVPLVVKNGRDHLVDAYQEMLDGAAYTRAACELISQNPEWKEESSLVRKRWSGLSQIYVDLLDMAKELRAMIHDRDGK